VLSQNLDYSVALPPSANTYNPTTGPWANHKENAGSMHLQQFQEKLL
jgi:hypothetical protein